MLLSGRTHKLRRQLFELAVSSCPAQKVEIFEEHGEETAKETEKGFVYDSEDEEHPAFIRLSLEPAQPESGSAKK